jgi:peroxiredoxin
LTPTSFQNSLKQITFKTLYHDQLITVDYDKLFANQRVIIFSLPTLYFFESHLQISQYINEYENFIDNKINNIYTISSHNKLVGAWVNANYQTIFGLPDKNKEFVSALAMETKSTKNIDFLARHWEYVAIINDGNLERFWQNPIPETISLRHYRYGIGHPTWEKGGKVQDLPSLHYRKLGPEVVLEYLKNSVDQV